MNIPNKLTLIRICLIPFFIFFLLCSAVPCNYILALIVFLAASITDHFDGKIARKTNQITDFGKFADPLADKILVISAFLCFIELDLLGAVPVVIIIAREFIVTGIRLVSLGSGKVIDANKLGKIKTFSQMAAVILMLVYLCVLDLFSVLTITINPTYITLILKIAAQCCVWICVLLTVISGVKYITDNKNFIKLSN